MNKAVFLDRDGTININKPYLYKINDFSYLPGAIEGLKLFQDAGYLLIIITNQSGIARGFFDLNDYNILTNWMLRDLLDKGIVINDVYTCPHLPNGIVPEYRKSCSCRKPLLGLFHKAISDYQIDIDHSIAIGDEKRDLQICKESHCKGFLIEKNIKEQTEDDTFIVVKSIYEAAMAVLYNE